MPDTGEQKIKRIAADDAELEARGKTLEAELAKRAAEDARNAHNEKKWQEVAGSRSMWGVAFRISADFFSAVIVGAAIGYAIDKWVTWTAPWALVVFVLLGCVAGFMNIMRAIGKPLPYKIGPGKLPGDEDKKDLH